MFASQSRTFPIGFLLVALTSGCGDRLSRPVAKTDIPNSPFKVSLYGPDSKRHYHYTVSDQSSVLIDRFIGPAQVSQPVDSVIVHEGAGRYRTTWGSGVGAAFTLIDTAERRIIMDTNQANMGNQPF
jgi:hypothetical protein